MIKRILCIVVMIATTVIATPSASAEETLSPGCAVANNPGYDGLYTSVGLQQMAWSAGERLTVAASPPVELLFPVQAIELYVGGALVDSASFPGVLDYTFTSDQVVAVEWTVRPGFNNLTWTVTCTRGASPPDCSAVTASPDTLKANRKMYRVTLSGATSPTGEALAYSITGVTQDEPISGLRPNDRAPDAADASDASVSLRGERAPNLRGRVYRISFVVTDAGGDACSGVAFVGVPLKHGGTALDEGSSWDSFTGAPASFR